MVTAAMKSEDNCFLAGNLWQTRQFAEKQRHYSANKGPFCQSYGLPRGHLWLWKLNCKESKMPKTRCLRTVMLEKTPKSPLDSKEIKPVNLKGDQHWLFTGRTDAEALVFWSCDAHRWFIDAGKDWEQKEKESEDEMVGWHHWCNVHKLGQTQEDGEGQRGLACHSPWGHKESDMT